MREMKGGFHPLRRPPPPPMEGLPITPPPVPWAAVLGRIEKGQKRKGAAKKERERWRWNDHPQPLGL